MPSSRPQADCMRYAKSFSLCKSRSRTHVVTVVRHERDLVAALVAEDLPESLIVDQDEIPGTGRAVELDALVTVVQELGALVNVPTPFTNALLGLARLHAQVRGLY